MGARRYRRGPKRRDELRLEGETRQEKYDKLTTRYKIIRQVAAGHDGRQLQKLYSKLEREESNVRKEKS